MATSRPPRPSTATSRLPPLPRFTTLTPDDLDKLPGSSRTSWADGITVCTVLVPDLIRNPSLRGVRTPLLSHEFVVADRGLQCRARDARGR